jgi:K+-sensing histidine kinase KdpD
MLQKILSGYKKLFGGLFKIFALLAVCVGFGFLLVYPLWYFATAKPRAYTFVVFCAFACAVTAFIAAKIKTALKGATKEERRKKRTALALGAAKAAIVIFGVCVSCAFIIGGMRLFALLTLIASVALYGVCAFGAKDN